MTADEILKKYEDDNEYHLHDVDRKWVIAAMEEYAALRQQPVSGLVFEEFHCQKDYITNTITVQFRGDFDKEKAIDYMLRCYPSFEGREVIELSPNYFYMGLENIGYAVFQ